MTEKKFPHIRLTRQSIRGNYFGAYGNADKNSKQGYTIFISHNNKVHDSCECDGYVHGKPCYHLKDAKALEEMLFEKKERGV